MHTLVMCSINIICRYTIELFFPRTEWIKENEQREHAVLLLGRVVFMDARAIGMVTLNKKQRIRFSIAVDFKCDWMQRNIENGKEYYYRFWRGNSKDRLFILSAYDSITKKTQHLLFMCPWPLDCVFEAIERADKQRCSACLHQVRGGNVFEDMQNQQPFQICNK